MTGPRSARTGEPVLESAPSGGAVPVTQPRVLVVGVGNVLNGDDGFGVEVARKLAARPLPPGVRVTETGIGGIHLVHELMEGYDALVVVDAVDRGRPPGTVMVIEAEVLDVSQMETAARHDLLADMHLAIPERALMVARAVGVLPERTVIVGCQPRQIETLGTGLTEEVAAAVDQAVTEVERCLTSLLAPLSKSLPPSGLPPPDFSEQRLSLYDNGCSEKHAP